MTDRATSEVFATAFLLRGRENFGTKSTATKVACLFAQVAVCLVVRLQKAGTAHYARRRARPARRPHRFEFRTADTSGIPTDRRRSSLLSTRLTRQTHAPRGRPRTVWYFLDSTRNASRFHLMGRTATGFYGRDILSTTIKVQCNAHHSDTGRGSSSIAEGALPYDVVHLAGGGRA